MVARDMGITEDDFVASIARMVAAGDFEVAARACAWAQASYPESGRVAEVRKQVFLMLIQKYQMLNPFKLTMYANTIGIPVPQLPAVKAGE